MLAFTEFMECFVGVLPSHIYAEHPSISEYPLPIMKDPCPLRSPPPPFLTANWLQCHFFSLCLSLRISTAEGQPWLEWEQRVFKCKVIHSAVEGGRLGLQVEEDIRKGGLCVCFISFFLFLFPFVNITIVGVLGGQI